MTNNDNVASRHHPNLDDRQAAERKLCRLFSSFGIDALAARERLIDPFIKRAAHFRRNHSSLDLPTLVLDEAEMDLRAWFVSIIGVDDTDEHAAIGQSSLMTGRAAFLMCAGPERFTDMVLRPVDDLPAAFINAMRAHAPIAVPPSEHGDMHHQLYEAWSLRHVIARTVPVNKSMMQMLGDVMRRDGRGLGISWRNTGSTS